MSVLMILASCEADSAGASNILEISEFDVTLNDKPAVYIKFGENKKSFTELNL